MHAQCSVDLQSVARQDCTITDNERSAVCVCESASLVMLRVVIEASSCSVQKSGLILHDKSRSSISESIFRGHRGGNVVLQDSSTASFDKCEMEGGLVGLKLHGHSTTIVRASTLRNNRECNLLLLDEAETYVSRCALTDSGGAGIRCAGASRCGVSYSSIMNNAGAGIVACGPAGRLDMRGNRVSQNGGSGVEVDSGRLQMRGNVLFDNKLAALTADSLRSAAICHNTFMGMGGPSVKIKGPALSREAFTGNTFFAVSDAEHDAPHPGAADAHFSRAPQGQQPIDPNS
ncbi:hypothetical protein T484DRAFT_1759689 [Baffinella frigidus]|nr:hypothetical protein T484DRAFT_1759689 [Cryptophyta sp. CCMP2293]